MELTDYEFVSGLAGCLSGFMFFMGIVLNI